MLISMTTKISDQILEGLELDFRLMEFLFFQSTQDNSDYHRLIADIQVYVSSPSFKMNIVSELSRTSQI